MDLWHVVFLLGFGALIVILGSFLIWLRKAVKELRECKQSQLGRNDEGEKGVGKSDGQHPSTQCMSVQKSSPHLTKSQAFFLVITILFTTGIITANIILFVVSKSFYSFLPFIGVLPIKSVWDRTARYLFPLPSEEREFELAKIHARNNKKQFILEKFRTNQKKQEENRNIS